MTSGPRSWHDRRVRSLPATGHALPEQYWCEFKRMRMSRRIVTFVAASVLALQSVAPLTSATTPTDSRAQMPTPPGLQPPGVDQARLTAALRSKIPIDPVGLTRDPYLIERLREPASTRNDTVCGIRFERDQVHYRLSTFANAAAAHAAGFAITHFGACGTCSTLQDLAVYLEKRDLTAPVRSCGIRWNAPARLHCVESLGFSRACAQTWLYDIQNTRHECFGVCVWS